MSSSASSAAVLSVVQHVTANKANKVAIRLAEIVRHSQEVDAALTSTSSGSNLDTQVLVLLDTLRTAFPGGLHPVVYVRNGHRCDEEPFKDRLDTIERMLWETKYSPGFSDAAVLAWKDELLGYLRQARQRTEYTALFGDLANEWAELRFGELASKADSDGETSVAVGRKEMHEQRQIWESHVTVERRSDTAKIIEFLDDLFQSGEKHEAKREESDKPTDARAVYLSNFRQKIRNLCRRSIPVNDATVRSAIDGVLAADQLTSEKRRAMRDIRNRDNIIGELVDILRLDTQLSALSQRSYSDVPVTVQMRKAINGKYRVYLDLELLDAILIQIVGQFLSTNIKGALAMKHCDEDGQNDPKLAALEAQLTNFSSNYRNASVHAFREESYTRIFEHVRLPNSMRDSDTQRYDASDEASDIGMGLSNLETGTSDKINLRTDILRFCAAEMGVQRLVHGQFCILQSDFEWFGPSMPHTTLLTLMEYYHFPAEFITLFRSFLSMRMKFEEDGPDGPIHTRKTGIPISFQLCDGIAELVLSALDFAVERRTGGAHLFRNHDDLWFWGQPEQCAVAWDTIREFTDIMGLRLNKDKTAFACAVDKSNSRYVEADSAILARMPENRVKWGLLCFDPESWSWTANKKAIQDHMDELRFQLKSRTAVMAYVQAYNAYMKNFLPNNFCPVITGLGDNHATTVLQALKYAQSYLFRDTANVAEHVRTMIRERFDKRYADVPDCFLYSCIEDGGLGLANPAPAFAQYVDVSQHENKGKTSPMALVLKTARENMSDAYYKSKAEFEKRRGKKRRREDEDVEFMSFSEFVGNSELFSSHLCTLYKTLLKPPVVGRGPLSGRSWAGVMFRAQLDDLFGGHLTEKQLLSLELYRTLAEEKVRWDG